MLGGAGAGQTAKICTNMPLGLLMQGSCEASALGVADGLGPKLLPDRMRRSACSNWALEKYKRVPGVIENAPASRHCASGFGTERMLEDPGAQQNGAAVRAAAPPAGPPACMPRQLGRQRSAALEFSSVVRLLQRPPAGRDLRWRLAASLPPRPCWPMRAGPPTTGAS
jgi:3-hydroxyisobutyrate dehydrogenase